MQHLPLKATTASIESSWSREVGFVLSSDEATTDTDDADDEDDDDNNASDDKAAGPLPETTVGDKRERAIGTGGGSEGSIRSAVAPAALPPAPASRPPSSLGPVAFTAALIEGMVRSARTPLNATRRPRRRRSASATEEHFISAVRLHAGRLCGVLGVAV